MDYRLGKTLQNENCKMKIVNLLNSDTTLNEDLNFQFSFCNSPYL